MVLEVLLLRNPSGVEESDAPCPTALLCDSFESGEPFEPHLQLLGVLPPASHRLLPPAFWPLMTDPRSPIADFYPTEFDVQREERQAVWDYPCF